MSHQQLLDAQKAWQARQEEHDPALDESRGR